MATIEDAVNAKVLEPYRLPDWESRLPIRSLWVAYVFWDWADRDELHDVVHRVARRTLFEHVEQMFCDFRCSPRFPAGDLRRMLPNKKGVWKMHPPKLRIYGWCPAPHSFVAVAGAFESETKKDKKLNDKKRDEILDFIKTNQLQQHIVLGDHLAIFPPRS